MQLENSNVEVFWATLPSLFRLDDDDASMAEWFRLVGTNDPPPSCCPLLPRHPPLCQLKSEF